ncbi:hypothetical protein ACRRQX_000225 [Yersinia enterocolitica]
MSHLLFWLGRNGPLPRDRWGGGGAKRGRRGTGRWRLNASSD